MKSGAKRALLLIVSLVVSAVAAVWFVRTMAGHWGELVDELARANYLWLVPAVACIALSYVCRIARWRLFLSPLGPVGIGPLTSATLIGFMSSAVLPLRAGEVIRPFVLCRKSGIGFGHAVGSDAGLARTFDMLFGLGFLFLLAWGWMMASPAALGTGAGADAGVDALSERLRVLAGNPGFAALFVISLAGLLTVAAFPELVLRAGGLLLRPLPSGGRAVLMGFMRSVVESLQFLRNPLLTGGAVVLTMSGWLTYPAAAWCVARAFGIELSFLALTITQVILMVAIIVPQAPGFLGVFHYAAMEAARLFGVAEGPAGAFSLALWAVHTLPITLAGLGCLWYEGLSLGGLAQASRSAAAQPDVAPEEEPEGQA